jgi:hypothetical protein
MSTLAPGTLHVFTYKEGLLSPLAHDLRLTLARFTVDVQQTDVDARFEPQSLRVDGVMHGDTLDPGGVSDSQKREILGNVHDKILDVRRFPEIRFRGKGEATGDGWRVAGELTLVGRTQPLTVAVQRRDGRLAGRVELVPSRWGIQPFKAMLGTIRLQDRVTIAFDVPEPG